jgi:lipoprotein-anchoring transpeptidase ErfK/SrfK
MGFRTFNYGGRADFPYENYSDTTLSPAQKRQVVHSGEYDVDLPWAVLWIGQRGIYFHEWPQLPGSAGCIHLLSGDAKAFYDWLDQPTRLLFSWT